MGKNGKIAFHRGKTLVRECIENDYEMGSNEMALLQSQAAQPVRQRSNIE